MHIVVVVENDKNITKMLQACIYICIHIGIDANKKNAHACICIGICTHAYARSTSVWCGMHIPMHVLSHAHARVHIHTVPGVRAYGARAAEEVRGQNEDPAR